MKVFLAVVLVLALLLCAPVTVTASTHPSLRVRLRVLFLPFALYPRPPKKKKKKPAGQPEEEAAAAAKEKEDTGSLLQTLRTITDLLASLPGPLRKLLRAVKVVRLELLVHVCQADAAATAIRHGTVCAALYTAWGLLSSFVRVRSKGVHLVVEPDFTFGEEYVKMSTVLHLRVYGVLGAGLWLGWRFLRRQLRRGQKAPAPPAAAK